MFSKFRKLIAESFGLNHALIKAIRSDNYKNWEEHFNAYNKFAKAKANPKEMKSFGLEVYESNLRDCLSVLRITTDKKNLLNSIQFFFGLSNSDVSPTKRKYGMKAVEMLSNYRMKNNSLSSVERDEIRALGSELYISKIETDEIIQNNAVGIFNQFVSSKLVRGTLTDIEQQDINCVASALGLSLANLPLNQNNRDQYQHAVLLNQLSKGFLPTVQSSPIIVQKNEIVHWCVNAILLTSKTITTGYTSGYSGVSMRVMKGVSYRIGSSRSTPIRESFTVRTAGILVVTNKRLVFTGTNNAFSLGYNQLLSFDPYSNGIGLHKDSGKVFLLELPSFQLSEITFKILEVSLNNFFA